MDTILKLTVTLSSGFGLRRLGETHYTTTIVIIIISTTEPFPYHPSKQPVTRTTNGPQCTCSDLSQMRKYSHGYSVPCVSAQSPRKESKHPIILGAHGRDSSSKTSDFVLYISQLQAFNKSTVHSREHLGLRTPSPGLRDDCLLPAQVSMATASPRPGLHDDECL